MLRYLLHYKGGGRAMKIDVREAIEREINRLTMLRLEMIDAAMDLLKRELYELQQDYATREDFYCFRGMLIFAHDLGLINQPLHDYLKEQVAEIWDAYQEAAAPPNILNAPPTDPEQLTFFT